MHETRLQAGGDTLKALIELPENATGVVVFVHGSSSSRHSLRNQAVAQMLREENLGILLVDLLTEEEVQEDLVSHRYRFDIPLLAGRVVCIIKWLRQEPTTSKLKVGLIGSSTGAAAALIAATKVPVDAVVSRGGRPDLAAKVLPDVTTPTLLIVGECDSAVLELNEEAFALMRSEKRLEIVPGATHLFEEPGTLEFAAKLARRWFTEHF